MVGDHTRLVNVGKGQAGAAAIGSFGSPNDAAVELKLDEAECKKPEARHDSLWRPHRPISAKHPFFGTSVNARTTMHCMHVRSPPQGVASVDIGRLELMPALEAAGSDCSVMVVTCGAGYSQASLCGIECWSN